MSTVGDLSTFDDAWVIQGWGGETEIYDDSYQRATDYTNAVAGLENHCYVNCQYNAETNSNSFTGLRVFSNDWGHRFLVEVNALVDSLSTTYDDGKYYYVGQYNGHSYFRSSWGSNWENAKTQANEDGAYLLVINDEDERQYLQSVNAQNNSPYVGYYRESRSGSDFTMPGVWKWVSEFDPISDIDLRLEEATGATATITATIDKSYSQDVTITLSSENGSASVDEDFTLGSQTLTISQGALSASTPLTVQDDPLDEHDSDTVRIEVGSSNFAFASEDHELLIAIEDNDDMPAVSLSASQDTIVENNGTSNITATITSCLWKRCGSQFRFRRIFVFI